MDSESLSDRYARLQVLGMLAPIGECDYCDRIREQKAKTFPSHKPYDFCRSYKGGRNHCTCDTCF
jgi:hypothetical protein